MKKRTRKHRKLNPTFLLTVAVLIGLLSFGVWQIWRSTQPRFMDVMIELGQPIPEPSAFATEYADKMNAKIVSDVASITVNKVGVYPVTLKSGNYKETVTLTIRDTTAPVVALQNVAVGIGEEVSVDSFIVSITDFGKTEYAFVTMPEIPEAYGETPLQIRVWDDSGNETVGECKLICSWLKANYMLEIGQILTKADLLLDPDVDELVLDQAAIDHITWSGVGVYEIGGDWQGDTRICTVTVVDTTAPELELKPLRILTDKTAKAEDFVLSLSDASGTASVKLLNELTFGQLGLIQTVKIEATDASGNTVIKETTMEIVEDAPPEFSGLTDLVLSKYTIPDYTKGVTLADDFDTDLPYQVDDSKVQLKKAGTYFVTYSAVDSAGNQVSVKRRVIVENDISDTDILVAEHAEKCGNDVKSITDYVRNLIRYNSSDWGGDDPTYSGFTKGSGNCVVSANCLLAILEHKGYNAKLIWVKEEFEPHYWVIVEVTAGVWRHVDATRGVHAKYTQPMTDAQRLETLYAYGHQRYWDTSLWPACE